MWDNLKKKFKKIAIRHLNRIQELKNMEESIIIAFEKIKKKEIP